MQGVKGGHRGVSRGGQKEVGKEKENTEKKEGELGKMDGRGAGEWKGDGPRCKDTKDGFGS